MVGDDFILTEEKSHKIFNMPMGTTAPASVKAKLHHSVREPACTVDMVPDLKHNSLMSARKFANAQYIKVLTPTKVLVYDNMGDLQHSISSTAILRGWRCVNTPKRYTTGTRLGLSKGLYTNNKQRVNN